MCVAYHATNLQYAQSIMETELKKGTTQAYKDDYDLNHSGQKVGEGVYCSPFIEERNVMVDCVKIINVFLYVELIQKQ